MILNSEFRRVFQPYRTHLSWVIINIVIVTSAFGGLYEVANHIKTQIVPTGTVLLTTDYSKYVVGENIKYTLTNEYNSVVYITNQCPAEPLAVYRLSSTGWTRIHANAPVATCNGQLGQVSIEPRGSVTTSLAAWQSMFSQPGLYRLVALINNSSSLPLVDFQIITPPSPVIQQKVVFLPTTTTPSTKKSTSAQTSAGTSTNTNTVTNTATNTTSGNTQTTSPAANPQTYTLNVNSSGNYSPTSLSLKVGDSITFVYTPPYSDEVVTRFSAIAPTTSSISSVTVDHQFTSRTVTFNVKGTWSFKAEDHNGNKGQLTVN